MPPLHSVTQLHSAPLERYRKGFDFGHGHVHPSQLLLQPRMPHQTHILVWPILLLRLVLLVLSRQLLLPSVAWV